MPLTIAVTAFLGWWVAGLVPASAILLGAVLAPTDPVLANDVQTTDPGTPDGSSVRLTLTTEAGLNDGLAFPFTNLAIALAVFQSAAAELVSSYGFIAVFVSACIFRQKRPEHEYQKRVHQFSVTMEGLVEGILMLIIGGYLVFGVLKSLTFPMIAVSVAIIFLVRPISALIAFTGSDLPKYKKWVVSFFGIRGIGSLYSLSLLCNLYGRFPSI